MQLGEIRVLKLSQLHPFFFGLHRPVSGGPGVIARVGKAVLLAWGLFIVGCGGSGLKETPEIITVYACSNYCPGPDNIYQKRVYRGIVDPRQCRQLDGEPYTYGLKTVCIVQ